MTATGADPPATRWRVANLSVVAEADGYLVGDTTTGSFVLLPSIGVDVLDWLREGRTLPEIDELAGRSAGQHVDVASFVDALESMRFISALPHGTNAPSQDPAPNDSPVRDAQPARVDRVARSLFGPLAWALYLLAALWCIGCLLARPEVFPVASDVLFLSTPARSLAAITVITLVLATVHEGAHWLAARAVGVRASVTVSRRLFLFALETDLTGLWSVPRRRRHSPVLAGMAFDTVALAVLLAVRVLAGNTLPIAVGQLLATLTFVQLSALLAQMWFFLRTDVYAILVTITGTMDLYRTTWLSLLAVSRLASQRQRAQLAAAPPRDVAVARWYRWVWVPGMAGAAWFFVTYFVPVTWQTLTWVGSAVWPLRPQTMTFWEALILTAVIASPTITVIAVAARDTKRVLTTRTTRFVGGPAARKDGLVLPPPTW